MEKILLGKYAQFPDHELKMMGLIPRFDITEFKKDWRENET